MPGKRKIRISAIQEALRSSLWFIPALCVISVVALALATIEVDHRAGPQGHVAFAFSGGPASAQIILSTIASSMITFTGLVFSITMVVLQLASGQFSPRVLRTFLRDRISQFSLGTFVATFTYALVVLRSIRLVTATSTGYVPGLSITVAFALVLFSLGVFVSYIHHIAQSIRVVSIIESVADEARRLIDELYPANPDPSPPPGSAAELADPRVIRAPRAGVVLDMDASGLVEVARQHGAVLALVAAVGDFVPEGAPLFHVFGGDGTLADEEATRRIRMGIERTMQQDLAFGFRQLVDIAERALSPSVNDPTTAVQAIDRIHDLLRRLATRPFPSGLLCDREGRLRLTFPTATWEGYVELGVQEIRQYGSRSMQVARRLRAMLDDLLTIAMQPRAMALRTQLGLLDAMVQREFRDPADRLLAGEPDQQGMGA